MGFWVYVVRFRVFFAKCEKQKEKVYFASRSNTWWESLGIKVEVGVS